VAIRNADHTECKVTVNGRIYGNRNQATAVINPYLLLVMLEIWLCKFFGLDLNLM
jgi:hypothetical protein